MAAVTYTDGKARNMFSGETLLVVWSSPATMDSGDTVILPTITGKTPYILSAWDGTTGDACTATISTQTVTIDTAGSTTDHVYNILFTYI